jgi:hypothetical protein
LLLPLIPFQQFNILPDIPIPRNKKERKIITIFFGCMGLIMIGPRSGFGFHPEKVFKLKKFPHKMEKNGNLLRAINQTFLMFLSHPDDVVSCDHVEPGKT